jgi:predicted phosphodiesterase
MRFGILSDTHGNQEGLREAVDFLTEKLHVKRILHLGHDYNDIDELMALKRSLARGDNGDTTDFFSDLAEALTTTLDLTTRTVLKAEESSLASLRRMIVRVPGEGDEAYVNGHQAHVEYEMFSDRIIGLVHNVKEMKKEDIATAHIIFYGGSHLYQVDRVGHRYFINPGHLMRGIDKGREPTFAFMDAAPDVPVLRIYALDGSVKLEKELVLDKKNKFSAG